VTPAEDDPKHAPPGAWEPAQRIARKLTRPLERFLQVEASSGLVLLGAALVALVWANSPLGPLYERLWETHVTLALGDLRSSETIHFWVNDGLMVVFFFVVGLEIRREIHAGELSEWKRAALPVAAALGGMAAPAVLYLVVNHSGPAREGWGVPMATDIAFAVGVLALLGKRVPAALRVFLLALAIIDDLGAIVVIALFYSGSLAWVGGVVALGGLAGVVALQKLGVRQPLAYVVPGVVIWWGTLRLGVHPTIAGVALGLLTPVEPWYGREGFVRASTSAIRELRTRARTRATAES
jgi:NhaA family Na+:H+ antiporter